MKKIWVGLVGVLAVGLLVTLTGCRQQPQTANVGRNSRQLLAKSELTWVQTGQVTGKIDQHGNLKKAKLHQTPKSQLGNSLWITDDGKLDGSYQQISYDEAKRTFQKNMRDDSDRDHYQMTTIKQFNEALAAAKANIRVKRYSDLTYYKSGNINDFFGRAVVASGKKLYMLDLTREIQTDKETEAYLITIYTRDVLKAPTKHLSFAKLAGQWQNKNDANDQLQVKGEFGYQVTKTINGSTDVTRFKIQDLRQLSATALYTGTFIEHQRQVAAKGYYLPKATSLAGVMDRAIYLFISENELIRVINGTLTKYVRTPKNGTKVEIPATIAQVYDAFDQQNNPQVALSVMTLSTDSFEVVSNEANQLTNYTSLDLRDYKFAFVNDQQVTIRDASPGTN
ncbi:hypothetical protein [Lapidilactobacillus wuchangensis]|uniref:hypothetical protein n=1 Tax=Lapidilactobacillus wuchangensis TaxID=2486001 RepID=UPI000F78465D|nr:hypothetical protein [Lapidilactobacillus wuchangensis]